MGAIIPAARVKGELVIGEVCEVGVRKKVYFGQVGATGKPK